MNARRTSKPKRGAAKIERRKALAAMPDLKIGDRDNRTPDAAFWADAVVMRRAPKEQISICPDAGLLERFRTRDRCQTKINEVPRADMDHHRSRR